MATQIELEIIYIYTQVSVQNNKCNYILLIDNKKMNVIKSGTQSLINHPDDSIWIFVLPFVKI